MLWKAGKGCFKKRKGTATDAAPNTTDTFRRMSPAMTLLDLTMWVSFGGLIKSHFHGEARLIQAVQCEETR